MRATGSLYFERMAARLTAEPLTYLTPGDDEPRRDESSDFRFPTVRFDSARRTFFASSGDGEVIPVARFRQDPAFEWPELAPGAKIFLLKENGDVTATFTATKLPARRNTHSLRSILLPDGRD